MRRREKTKEKKRWQQVEAVKKVKEERWEEEGSEEEHGAEENWEIPVHKYYQNDSSARRNKSNDRMPPSKTHDTSGNPKPELEIMGADGYSAMS